MFSVKRLNGKFATDTAYGKVKSLQGNVGSRLFSHKCGFKACYPLQKIDGGNSVGDALTQFISDYGVTGATYLQWSISSDWSTYSLYGRHLQL